jgi:hypothetical protein
MFEHRQIFEISFDEDGTRVIRKVRRKRPPSIIKRNLTKISRKKTVSSVSFIDLLDDSLHS